MNKISLIAASVALACSASAQAWWGGPGNGWSDWLGDGWGDMNFNMNFNGRGHGWGRGYDYYAPYYGHVPYNYGAVPLAPYYAVPPVPQSADQAQSPAQAAQQDQIKALQEAAEAQRKYAEQMMVMPMPRGLEEPHEALRNPMEGQRPEPFGANDRINDRIQAAKERRDSRYQEMQARRSAPMGPGAMDQQIQERMKQAEERRESLQKEVEARRQHGPGAMDQQIQERLKQAEERREAMLKEMQAHRPYGPMAPMPPAVMDPQLQERMKQADERRDSLRKEMESRRQQGPDARNTTMEGHRKQMQERREAMRKEMEERRLQAMQLHQGPFAPPSRVPAQDKSS